jgi:hypothetical protein
MAASGGWGCPAAACPRDSPCLHAGWRVRAAFFDIYLRGAGRKALDHVPAPTDVYVNVYPLGDQPPLPASG